MRSQAFMRSALNIGFTIGALIGGLALATNSDAVVRMVPILTSAILGINFLLILRLPHAESEVPSTDEPLAAARARTGRDPARPAARACSATGGSWGCRSSTASWAPTRCC